MECLAIQKDLQKQEQYVETVKCILREKQLRTAESTTCIVATETPTCKNVIKTATPILNAETVTCI